jgi:uncharacterized protein (DUF433 family)
MAKTVTESVILVDPEIMHGTPCFRGTRVPLKNLADYLRRRGVDRRVSVAIPDRLARTGNRSA